MSRTVIGGKYVAETRKETFDFISQLASGETISSAATTAVVYSGTDATPSTILSGAASISGTQVTQTLTGGVAGVTYMLTVVANTSTGQSLNLTAFLVIIPVGL